MKPIRMVISNKVTLLRMAAIFVAVMGIFAGCMSDPIVGPQAVPRLVNGPFNAYFFATNYQAPNTGDMVIRWTHAPSDTQLNFKGYYIRVYSSSLDTTAGALAPYDLHQLLDTVRVPKFGNHVDTNYIVSGLPIGYYTIMINGEQVSDTVRLSVDTFTYSNEFDPRPLTNPTNVQATSVGPSQVKLHWTPSPTETLDGFYKYYVYYLDPSPLTNITDSAHFVQGVPKGTNELTVSIPQPANTTGVNQAEHPYRFWVKSVRADSVQFYDDSSSVIWSGAETVPVSIVDVGLNIGFAPIRHSIFFGSYSGHWDVVDDSNRSDAQVEVTINSDQSVTLTPVAGNAMLLPEVDPALDLDSIYYSVPFTSGFSSQSITLPASPTDTLGRVVYVQIVDKTVLVGAYEYARIFVNHQSGLSSFVNPGGWIDIKGSFQPGLDKAGDAHLLYY